jgi:hypothetical protein
LGINGTENRVKVTRVLQNQAPGLSDHILQAELCYGLAEITKVAMPPNLRGVVPTSLALAVVEKATELFDLDLPGEAVDNAVWYVGKVLKKSTQEARRAELDGEAQAVVVTAMGVDQPPVAINEAGGKFQSISEPWANTTTHAGKMIMTVFAGIAEFERDLIRERTGAGREAAKKRGVRFGRPRKLNADQAQVSAQLLAEGKTVRDIARTFNVHEATIYRLAAAL